MALTSNGKIDPSAKQMFKINGTLVPVPDDADQKEYGDLIRRVIDDNYAKRFHWKVYRYYHKEGSGFDTRRWVIYLEWLASKGIVTRHYELCCGACDESIAVHDDIDPSLIGTEMECNHCGESFEIEKDSWILFYSITPQHAAEITAQMKTTT